MSQNTLCQRDQAYLIRTAGFHLQTGCFGSQAQINLTRFHGVFAPQQ